MILCVQGIVLALATTGISNAAAPEVETALLLDTPAIEGEGPFTITVKGTVSLSKDEKDFVGVSASGFGEKNFGLVNLPDGAPKPGGPAKRVTFTWLKVEKGKYEGVAKMKFTNAKGKMVSVVVEIAEFEVK